MKLTKSPVVATGSGFYATNKTLVDGTASALASASDAKVIINGVKTFARSSKVLMKALDGISQAHPFAAGIYSGRYVTISSSPSLNGVLFEQSPF